MVIYALYFYSKNHDQKQYTMYNIFVKYIDNRIDNLLVLVYTIIS